MEQTERINIAITCPISTAMDDNQSLCLLRYRPQAIMPVWITKDEKAASISIFIDNSGLISLLELEGQIRAGDALEYLRLIAQAAYTASDHLLNIDLRLLSPELIFFETGQSDRIKIISLPVLETTDITVRIKGQKAKRPESSNLIRWLGAENAWTEEMIRELNHLFLNKRWSELIGYLRELINQMQSQLAEIAVRESISENSRQKSTRQSKRFRSESIPSASLCSKQKRYRVFQTKPCTGNKGGVSKILKSKREHKKAKKTGEKISASALLRSWGDWLGITSREKRQSELIDLEPTENLPNRMPNYRLAMLSEGLPGTQTEDEGQKAFILVDEFIVGRDTNKADLFLDSAAVGRRHARIIRRGENFFIEDLGSINNTLLDGKRLDKFREILLPDRCRLTFADRSFYFSTDSK